MTSLSFPQGKAVVALTLGTSLQVTKATAEKGLTDWALKEVIKKKMKMMAQIQRKSAQRLRPHQHLHRPETSLWFLHYMIQPRMSDSFSLKHV